MPNNPIYDAIADIFYQAAIATPRLLDGKNRKSFVHLWSQKIVKNKKVLFSLNTQMLYYDQESV